MKENSLLSPSTHLFTRSQLPSLYVLIPDDNSNESQCSCRADILENGPRY